MTKYQYRTTGKEKPEFEIEVTGKHQIPERGKDARVRLVNDLGMERLDQELVGASCEWVQCHQRLDPVLVEIRQHEESLDARKSEIIKRAFVQKELTAGTVKEREAELKAVVSADAKVQVIMGLLLSARAEKGHLERVMERMDKIVSRCRSQLGWRQGRERTYMRLAPIPDDQLSL